MSTFDSPPDDCSNDKEFNQALNSVIRTAMDNGVNVRGGWRVDGPSEYDLGIEIYRVTP